jgi:hypothetical protein
MRARSRRAAIRLSSFSLSAQVIASLGVFLLERAMVRNALSIPGGKNEAKRHPDFPRIAKSVGIEPPQYVYPEE